MRYSIQQPDVPAMRAEYDFTKARKNPYAAQLDKQITIRLDEGNRQELSETRQMTPACAAGSGLTKREKSPSKTKKH